MSPRINPDSITHVLGNPDEYSAAEWWTLRMTTEVAGLTLGMTLMSLMLQQWFWTICLGSFCALAFGFRWLLKVRL